MNNTTSTISDSNILNHWWIPFVWILMTVSIIHLYLVNAYLASKPLGSQTLLDKAYTSLFNLTMCFIGTKMVIDSMEEMGIKLDDTTALVISWLRFFMIELNSFTFLLCVVVNIILVFKPGLFEDYSDKTIIYLCVGIVTSLGFVTSVGSYFIGAVPLNYLQLTKSDKGSWKNQAIIRVVTMAVALMLGLFYRVYISCMWKTYREGEGNILSNTTIIIIACYNFFHQILLKNVTSYKLIPQAIHIYVVSLSIILNKKQLREYCARHIVRSSLWIATTAWIKYLRDLASDKARHLNRVDPLVELE